jgi:hypothetical protein
MDADDVTRRGEVRRRGTVAYISKRPLDIPPGAMKIGQAGSALAGRRSGDR